MKRKVNTLPAALLLTLTACSASGDTSSKGVVVDATMNTLTIVNEKGDTLSFGTAEADRSQANGLLIGDTIEVFYKGNSTQTLLADSLVLRSRKPIDTSDGLGAYLVRTYEGLLPAADGPGIRYTLTVNSREHSGDGTFSLIMTYLEAENGEDRSFTYEGKRLTLRGTPDNNDATVWQLVTDDGKDTFNFLVESDTTLTLLNDQFQRNDSKLNYTLVRTN